MSQTRKSGSRPARSSRKDQSDKTPNWSSDTIVINGQAFAIIFPEE